MTGEGQDGLIGRVVLYVFVGALASGIFILLGDTLVGTTSARAYLAIGGVALLGATGYLVSGGRKELGGVRKGESQLRTSTVVPAVLLWIALMSLSSQWRVLAFALAGLASWLLAGSSLSVLIRTRGAARSGAGSQ